MLTLYLDEKSKDPYYLQIYEQLRDKVSAGELKKDEKLPSGRRMAENLGVSRTTVDMAYSQLMAEGYIYSRDRSGYYVADIGQLINMIPVYTPTFENEESAGEESPVKYDFAPAGAEALNFPEGYFKRMFRQVLAEDDGTLFDACPGMGDPDLRRAIADYLKFNRGVNTDADHILVGAGSQYLMMILLKLLDEDTVYAMENPGFVATYNTLKALGASVVPVGVDSRGIDVAELEQTSASAVYVTPSHQFPLGVVMSASRRRELINWTRREPGRYIIEDDYDSEFRYHGKPISALKSMDSNDRIVYMGSFSKVISSAMRISYLVLPESLRVRYLSRFRYFPSTVSKLEQVLMTRFLTGGSFERHLNRIRLKYKGRHDLMISVLEGLDDVSLTGVNAGSYIVMECRKDAGEEELTACASDAGIRVYPMSDYCIAQRFQPFPQFLMGFVRMDEEELKNGLETLIRVWGLT